jgi:hypothetical protein
MCYGEKDKVSVEMRVRTTLSMVYGKRWVVFRYRHGVVGEKVENQKKRKAHGICDRKYSNTSDTGFKSIHWGTEGLWGLKEIRNKLVHW